MRSQHISYIVKTSYQTTKQQSWPPTQKQSYINFSKQTITTNISPPPVSSANAIFERGE